MRAIILLVLWSICSLLPLCAVTVFGSVVAPGGKPLVAAKVALRSTDNCWPSHAVTNARGGFTFNLHAPLVKLDSVGEPALAYLPGYGITPCSLKLGHNKISLFRSRTVSGRVVDESGHPVLDASVRLECLFSEKGLYVYLPEELKSFFRVRTDKNGWWTMTDLPSIGTASFSLDDPHYLCHLQDTQTEVYATLDRPNARTSVIVAQPAALISGRVVTKDGVPVPAGTNVELTLDIMDSRSWNGIETKHVVTDADGRYVFGSLIGGTGTIKLPSESGESIARSVRNIHAKEGKEINVPDITLSRGGILCGHMLRVKTKEPIADAHLIINPTTYTPERSLGTRTAIDGTFTANLPPGTYTIQPNVYINDFLRHSPEQTVTIKAGEVTTVELEL